MRLIYMVGLMLVSSGVYAMEEVSEEIGQSAETIRKVCQPSLYSKKIYICPALSSTIPNRAINLSIMRSRKNNEPHNRVIFEQLEQETLQHHMELLKCAFSQKNHNLFQVIISSFSELKERPEYQNLISVIWDKISTDSSYPANKWEKILNPSFSEVPEESE